MSAAAAAARCGGTRGGAAAAGVRDVWGGLGGTATALLRSGKCRCPGEGWRGTPPRTGPRRRGRPWNTRRCHSPASETERVLRHKAVLGAGDVGREGDPSVAVGRQLSQSLGTQSVRARRSGIVSHVGVGTRLQHALLPFAHVHVALKPPEHAVTVGLPHDEACQDVSRPAASGICCERPLLLACNSRIVDQQILPAKCHSLPVTFRFSWGSGMCAWFWRQSP
jgi:hypothetical protein